MAGFSPRYFRPNSLGYLKSSFLKPDFLRWWKIENIYCISDLKNRPSCIVIISYPVRLWWTIYSVFSPKWISVWWYVIRVLIFRIYASNFRMYTFFFTIRRISNTFSSFRLVAIGPGIFAVWSRCSSFFPLMMNAIKLCWLIFGLKLILQIRSWVEFTTLLRL